MHIVRQNKARIIELPVDGNGSDIQIGALLMRGVTDEVNRGVAILATSAAADAIGILAELHDFSVDGDTTMEDGAVLVKHPVEIIKPGDEVFAELADDASNDVDVASYSNGTVTITSLEDDIDGGWMYVRAGAGVGQVGYIKESASGSCVLKSAFTTALDNTSKVLILRPLFHQTVELDSTASKIKSTAAAGNLPWRILEHLITYDGLEGWKPLDMVNHHNLQLNGKNARFALVLAPADTLHNPLD